MVQELARAHKKHETIYEEYTDEETLGTFMKPLVIGIAGGTGSGKTTLTNALVESFEGQVAVIYHDNYYKRHDEFSYEERCQLNYDAPEAFDNDLLIEHLDELLNGQDIETPVYDYTVHNRSDQTMSVNTRPIIIIEGILIFAEERICSRCDIKIFVDTDADVRILRRMRRDVLERQRTIESVEQQYLTTVKPMHELYVEPSKRQADIIVPEGGSNLVALEMLIHRVQNQLAIS
ncbi:uridine kinase [Rothia sp. P7208]|uniref:uridine kinase n=1 Tax=Rothia sp. P7208 TaxID=3402660 RepID=UPI003AC9EDFF